MKTITGLGSFLCGLDGKPALDGDVNTPLNERRPIIIGHVIANVLAGSASKEPARVMNLAMQIFPCPEPLELEDIDYKLVFETIDAAQFSNLSKAAALAVLNGAGSKEEK